MPDMNQPLGEGGGFKYAVDQCLVACKGDDGNYYLVTRQVFRGREAAEAYRATCNPAREPIIVTAVKPIMWDIKS